MGRPPRPGGQRRAGVHGLRDLRLRVRPRGRLGAGGDHLGTRGRVAGRGTLRRRGRDGTRGGRHRDGTDLRQPRGSDGQSGSACGRGVHPRDLQADGDERRGDARADRRRAHVRQDPRCRRRRRARRSGAGGRGSRSAGTRLAELPRDGQGPRHHHLRHRGHLDRQADPVEQPVPRDPVRVRVGAHQEPGRRPPVGGQGRPGDHPGRSRPGQEASAHDAHHGPRAPRRPDLREDRAPVPGEPRRVRAGLRQGLVQASAPGHGSRRPPPPRTLGPRAPALAGPDPGRGPRAGRR